MKAKRDHRVPLSARALQVLEEARAFEDGSGLVFPSPRARAISDNTISKLLRELGIDAVPHGFRSSFPGLGGGMLRRAPRGLRARPGAREFRSGGGRLSSNRPVRAAAGADGRVVEIR